MSSLGDALQALKNVLLMQSGIARMQEDIVQTVSDLRGLREYVNEVDKRVVRIETMIEMSGRGSRPPQIEG
ncbi:MAG TPA: hypothetical protein VF481_03865 [Novosphingobium sp.]